MQAALDSMSPYDLSGVFAMTIGEDSIYCSFELSDGAITSPNSCVHDLQYVTLRQCDLPAPSYFKRENMNRDGFD